MRVAATAAVTAMADMRDIAERIRERIAGLDPGHPLTVSMGMALAAPGADPNQVFARADQALYRAKSQGRDRVAVAEPAEPVLALVG